MVISGLGGSLNLRVYSSSESAWNKQQNKWARNSLVFTKTCNSGFKRPFMQVPKKQV